MPACFPGAATAEAGATRFSLSIQLRSRQSGRTKGRAMDKDRENFGLAPGLWAAVPGAVLAGAIAVLLASAPVWGWIALAVFLALWGTALLSFTDPASRAFLAGTLRKSTYTQIYTTLTRRLLQRIWKAVCDEPGDPVVMDRERIGVLRLFRHDRERARLGVAPSQHQRRAGPGPDAARGAGLAESIVSLSLKPET
jgi:hypothetical protein